MIIDSVVFLDAGTAWQHLGAAERGGLPYHLPRVNAGGIEECMRILLLALSAGVTLAGCSAQSVQCEHNSTEGLSKQGLLILSKVEADTKSYCAAAAGGCRYWVQPHEDGWLVSVGPRDDACLVAIGGTQVYIYDEAGIRKTDAAPSLSL